MQMRPALRIAADATLEQFDVRYADGADYVIVPAVTDPADARMIAWLSAQAAKGATLVSICDGALVVARTGVFDGRRATGHWATHAQREREFPRTQWMKNVRWVADGKVVSSAGISAAIPTSLALVEAIAGRANADAVAADIGATGWNASHNSEQFGINAGMLLTIASNKLFHARDQLALTLETGMDDLTLAFAADAFSRTARSRVLATGSSSEPVRTRHGLAVLADDIEPSLRTTPFTLPEGPQAPLERILSRIQAMYGKGTAKLVADTLEYPLAAATQ
jgi:transcriptional regulator GlxA family with amidase domain